MRRSDNSVNIDGGRFSSQYKRKSSVNHVSNTALDEPEFVIKRSESVSNKKSLI